MNLCRNIDENFKLGCSIRTDQLRLYKSLSPRNSDRFRELSFLNSFQSELLPVGDSRRGNFWITSPPHPHLLVTTGDTQVTSSWTYITCCLPGSFGSFDGNRIGSQVISLLAQIFQVCFVHTLKEKCHLNVTQCSLRKGLSCNQQLSPRAHLTDIVGINFSLNELGQVRWQAVFVNNFFSFGFVDNLK